MRFRQQSTSSIAALLFHLPSQHSTMPPRLQVASLTRSVAFRPKTHPKWSVPLAARSIAPQCRLYSDSTDAPAADRSKRADAKPMEHVSEEKAAVAAAMGEEGPDLSQGTPVEEVR